MPLLLRLILVVFLGGIFPACGSELSYAGSFHERAGPTGEAGIVQVLGTQYRADCPEGAECDDLGMTIQGVIDTFFTDTTVFVNEIFACANSDASSCYKKAYASDCPADAASMFGSLFAASLLGHESPSCPELTESPTSSPTSEPTLAPTASAPTPEPTLAPTTSAPSMTTTPAPSMEDTSGAMAGVAMLPFALFWSIVGVAAGLY